MSGLAWLLQGLFPAFTRLEAPPQLPSASSGHRYEPGAPESGRGSWLKAPGPGRRRRRQPSTQAASTCLSSRSSAMVKLLDLPDELLLLLLSSTALDMEDRCAAGTRGRSPPPSPRPLIEFECLLAQAAVHILLHPALAPGQ